MSDRGKERNDWRVESSGIFWNSVWWCWVMTWCSVAVFHMTKTKLKIKDNINSLPVYFHLNWNLTFNYCAKQKMIFTISPLQFLQKNKSYIADDCCLVTDARLRKVCSAETCTLLVSRTCTNFGNRAFSAAGPRVWNCLPTDLRQLNLSYSYFEQSLKTFLFSQWDKTSANPP